MRTQRLLRSVFVALVVLALEAPAFAQGLEWVKANYTKHEYYVPMRDGVRLFTAVYIPKDTSQRYPILLNRTPYSVRPYGTDRYRENIGPSPLAAKDGYIVVYQDVRGRWMSEGEFDNMRPHKPVKRGVQDIDESTDTYDTIEWLLKNIPGHNGRVGQWGISYPGFYTAAGMIDAHPALKAASPQAPVTDWFATDDFHHNGALFLPHAFGFFRGFGRAHPKPTAEGSDPVPIPSVVDGYRFYLDLGPTRNVNEKYFQGEIAFWNEIMKHDTKDAFWQSRNIRAHLKNIRPAVMTVGGWFDAENLFGALEVYKNVEAASPGAFNVLVMGPWVHGGWSRDDGDSLADVRFDAKTAEFYREKIELPFFNRFLKDKDVPAIPEAYVFETGRNRWHQLDAWPPKNAAAKSLYLRANGSLSFTPPAETAETAFDEYVSDPAKPVPYIPGISFGMAQRYMVDDQRFASTRTDVLTYQTAVLEEDVTLAGPLLASLFVSTSGTDCDWVVKLIDVYPDVYPDAAGSTNNTLGAYQQMVRGDILRGKFRNSLEKPEPFTPGQPVKVAFELKDIFHTFRRGHRIMVQIQSTWFPIADRNPGKFMNINEATEADFQKTTQRVFRSRAMPSQIEVRVLPAEKP